jgi:hypothetical protein
VKALIPDQPPNQALKPTRLSVCHRGGPGSAENAAAHWLCTQSAVQLNAGVGPLVVIAGGKLES